LIAVVPTAQAAAARQAADPVAGSGICAADLRVPIRRHRAGHLVVLAVDTSGSMGVAAERLAAVKGALLALLVDAYQRRDRVALVTFRDDRAEVVLEPTASVELARRRLDSLATGGTTPLAAGLRRAVAVAHRHAADDLDPVVIVVTDGRATVGGRGLDPTAAVEEALELAASLAGQVPFVVVDVEDPSGPRLGLALRLASALGAAHVPLGSVTALRLEALLRGIGSKERS
jgi:magnesium chelatase subunit D